MQMMWQDSSDSASFVRRSTSHPTSVQGHCDLSHSSHRPGSRQLTPSFSVSALLLGAQSSSLKHLLHDHLLIITYQHKVQATTSLPHPKAKGETRSISSVWFLTWAVLPSPALRKVCWASVTATSHPEDCLVLESRLLSVSSIVSTK